ncbi:MAG: cytochrome C oxidase subunit IV family protein [Polyangia bacterium]
MAHDDSSHGHHSARMYYVTYAVLAACTVLTFTAAQHNFGRWSFAIAMFIAFVKAMFVVLFFMHLWDQKGPNRLTMAIAFVFVGLLITLTLTDAETRYPLAMPPGSHRAIHIGHTPWGEEPPVAPASAPAE